MLNKKSKFFLAAMVCVSIFVSFALTGCNNEGDSKEVKTDTVAAPIMEPVAPAVVDTGNAKMDTVKTRPIVPAN